MNRPEIDYTRELQRQVCDLLGVDSDLLQVTGIRLTPSVLSIEISEGLRGSTTWNYDFVGVVAGRPLET